MNTVEPLHKNSKQEEYTDDTCIRFASQRRFERGLRAAEQRVASGLPVGSAGVLASDELKYVTKRLTDRPLPRPTTMSATEWLHGCDQRGAVEWDPFDDLS